VALATAEAIRDRIKTLLEGLTPTTLTTKFISYRNEADADFDTWAEKNPAGALRRFQVREVGDDNLPETASGIEERIRVRFEIRIAYPQTSRYGAANGMDRDDVMNQDWKAINYVVGLYGRASFSGTNDCTPLGCTKSRESGSKVDYLVVQFDAEYLRQVA
jgi:hypothetical protein